MGKDFSTATVSDIWNQKAIGTSGGYLHSYTSFNNSSYKTSTRVRAGYSNPDYEFKGAKNKTSFPQFVKLLKKTQPQIKKYLKRELRRYYPAKDIHDGDGYLYIQGDEKYPVMLVAHMDTVHKEVIKDFYEREENGKHVLASPQGIGGDDRCGIWAILEIVKNTEMRPSILFCEDEEIGCVGANKFCKCKWADAMTSMKFIVEIDRRGNSDCVFYEDINEDFHSFVEEVTGYKEAYGSCSDICYLSEASGVSSVNLSSGYYHEHHFDEEIIYEEMMHTAEVVKELVQKSAEEDVKQFEYIENTYKYGGYTKNGYLYGYGYAWDDDYDYDGYIDKQGKEPCAATISDMALKSDLEQTEVEGIFGFCDKNGYYHEVTLRAESKLSVIGKFMIRFPEVSWDMVETALFELV